MFSFDMICVCEKELNTHCHTQIWSGKYRLNMTLAQTEGLESEKF